MVVGLVDSNVPVVELGELSVGRNVLVGHAGCNVGSNAPVADLVGWGGDRNEGNVHADRVGDVVSAADRFDTGAVGEAGFLFWQTSPFRFHVFAFTVFNKLVGAQIKSALFGPPPSRNAMEIRCGLCFSSLGVLFFEFGAVHDFFSCWCCSSISAKKMAMA